MKKIIIGLLLASISLIAADGEKLYKKRCASCHGEKVSKLAGMDTTVLALTIRSYRDQDEEGEAYTRHNTNQMMKESTFGLSRDKIVALAKYISGLK